MLCTAGDGDNSTAAAAAGGSGWLEGAAAAAGSGWLEEAAAVAPAGSVWLAEAGSDPPAVGGGASDSVKISAQNTSPHTNWTCCKVPAKHATSISLDMISPWQLPTALLTSDANVWRDVMRCHSTKLRVLLLLLIESL